MIIRLGIEEEVFLVNRAGFLSRFPEPVLLNLAKDLLQDEEKLNMARRSLIGIQWEPNPSQLEYVTRPLNPSQVGEVISFSRSILADAATKTNQYIYVGSMHPVDSSPLPMNGTHINVSITREGGVPSSKALAWIYSNVRNHLPELIAISANSPSDGFASSRLAYSKVLKESQGVVLRRKPLTFIPWRERGKSRYGLIFRRLGSVRSELVTNRAGDRLTEITIRGPLTNVPEDIHTSKAASRVEVRCLDNQSREEYLTGIAHLIAALSLQAVDMLRKGRKIEERRYLRRNRARAVRNGIKATFLTDDGPLSARESFLRMLDHLEPYLDEIGASIPSDLRRGIPERELSPPTRTVRIPEKMYSYEKNLRILLKVRIGSDRSSLEGGTLRRGEVLRGILYPECKLSFSEDGGLIRRFDVVEIRYWLLTSMGYVPLREEDEVLVARNPALYLAVRLRKLAKGG